MAIGKSIRIYLADSTVSGIRYAELVNWTGQAIACPRSRLAELQSWQEFSKPGVYFLFESKYSESKSTVYIGESENVLQRIINHDKNKDFWSEVVIFTGKDANLTKSHIKFMEASLVSLAKFADRYELENGNTPPESSLPRADRDAMEEFVANVRMVLGVLGFPILEPILKKEITIQDSDPLLTATADSAQHLTLTINKLTASGSISDEGFVLKKGSQVSINSSESMPGKLSSIKQRLIQNGELKIEDGYFIATDDILLSSSSYAAALVAGTSRSGPQSWKNKSGKTLKVIEEDLLETTKQSIAYAS